MMAGNKKYTSYLGIPPHVSGSRKSLDFLKIILLAYNSCIG
jgi:hypothetical protein